MKNLLLSLYVLLCVLLCQCSKEEPNPPIVKKSDAAELLTLSLEHEGIIYTTSIRGTEVNINSELPFGTQVVTVRSITISPKATINLNIGDQLTVDNSINLLIQAENGTMNNYTLSLTLASPEAKILSLTVRADQIYATAIEEKTVRMHQEMPYLNNYVIIESLNLSPGATANRAIGDTLRLPQKSFPIEIVAADNSQQQNYTLELMRDEGLEIQPNHTLEATSSYALQVSDVYMNGLQFTADWDRFFNQGYGDFNGDGHTDVLLAGGIFKSFEFSPFRLFYGDGTAVNSFACECAGYCASYQPCSGFHEVHDFLPPNSEGMQNPRKILTGDYNNDGKLDAFILGHGYDADPFPGESPVLLINNGNGFDYRKFTEHVGFDHGGASADIDNDGDVDIFVVASDLKSIFLINTGSGQFQINTDRLDSFFFSQTGYYTGELIDINLDGYMDLIIGGHEYEEGVHTYILWGNSYGKFFQALSAILPEVDNYKIIVDIDAEDIDNDGDRDLIISRVSDETGVYGFYDRHYIQILENQGDHTFIDKSEEKITDNSGEGWREWIHLQDLDNDGDIDIYYEGNDGPHFKWLNNGQGHFQKNP